MKAAAALVYIALALAVVAQVSTTGTLAGIITAGIFAGLPIAAWLAKHSNEIA